MYKIRPSYVTLSQTNLNQSSVPAQIQLSSNANIIDKMDDYVLAIERMDINVNGIPFFQSSTDSITITNNHTHVSVATATNITAYSLNELLKQLNQINFTFPALTTDLGTETRALLFGLDGDGHIMLTLTGSGSDFTNYFIDVSERLNTILGIEAEEQLTAQAENLDSILSKYPRIDCGDSLRHIMLTSNLPTWSDYVDGAREPVLTDFTVDTSYSNNLSFEDLNSYGILKDGGWSTNLRQKAIYNPPDKRYLELQDNFPLRNIIIKAFYINLYQEAIPILLPRGGVFEIKLGFYKKE